MCILFLYVAKNPPIISGTKALAPSLKLVIASNRDEIYKRPTKQAQFWDSDPNILAGQDEEERGTWLGISKLGKIALLLNIMGKAPAEKKRSRGDLVTGFLRSPPTLRGWTYCNNLYTDPSLDIRNNFGRFNLITIDLKPQSDHEKKQKSETHMGPISTLELTYLSNAIEQGPRTLKVGDGNIYAFGNSVYDNPFCKVTDGCRDFESLITKYKNRSVTPKFKEEIQSDILQFLKSSDQHFPDPQMEQQAEGTLVGSKLLPELSSIYVKSSIMNYGTRTHTVIFVDSNNHVDFHEWTLQEPIDCENPQWIQAKYEFNIS